MCCQPLPACAKRVHMREQRASQAQCVTDPAPKRSAASTLLLSAKSSLLRLCTAESLIFQNARPLRVAATSRRCARCAVLGFKFERTRERQTRTPCSSVRHAKVEGRPCVGWALAGRTRTCVWQTFHACIAAAAAVAAAAAAAVLRLRLSLLLLLMIEIMCVHQSRRHSLTQLQAG